ncbi:kappaPI-actitoxin-Avd3c-like [Stomoxys calcitrans]|uniref:BPTI/Kunitz inhibitor domain-containing protein n=1 Tax=Stomoxys calcitrans TaxID=35570 RepID=A0A1I8QAR2_STOCA|nr:kappaPI-actitoxin-Avd3c-like [Stomoxys calcitrans]
MKLFTSLVVIFALLGTALSLKDAICGLPREIGQCRASKPRFSYEPDSNECVKFIYGGCHGNENNFATKSQCEDKCKE